MNKKITILILCLAVITVVSGCIKKQPELVENNKPVATSTENNYEEILILTGQDEDGWNIYQSQKYGIEFKASENWEIKRYGEDKNKKYEYVIFDEINSEANQNNFSLRFYYGFDTFNIKNKEDFIGWQCRNSDFDICSEKYKKYTLDVFENNNVFIVKTIEPTGVGGVTSIFYYIFFNNNQYIFMMDDFNSEESIKLLFFNLVKTFKIIK